MEISSKNIDVCRPILNVAQINSALNSVVTVVTPPSAPWITYNPVIKAVFSSVSDKDCCMIDGAVRARGIAWRVSVDSRTKKHSSIIGHLKKLKCNLPVLAQGASHVYSRGYRSHIEQILHCRYTLRRAPMISIIMWTQMWEAGGTLLSSWTISVLMKMNCFHTFYSIFEFVTCQN